MIDIIGSLKVEKPNFKLNIDLNISNTNITAIMGKSGVGKTTLLRCIAGLEHSTKGYLKIDQEDYWLDSLRNINMPTHKRGVGFVFQDSCLFPHLDVCGNLNYALKRTPKSNRKIMWEDIIHSTGIKPLLKRNIHKLSGGEQQRVAIARAIIANPKLLLMDEPISSLDHKSQQELLNVIFDIHTKFKIPIIYVSHNKQEVATIADNVLLLENGKLCTKPENLNKQSTPNFIYKTAPPESINENRYLRHYQLPQIGKAGQVKLNQAKVLVIGAGGLGSPVLLYLAAAGIGTIGIIDWGWVKLSNLQRQVLFETGDIGLSKATAAENALIDLNPEINIKSYSKKLDADNINEIFSAYDIIVDGSDNFKTRLLVNRTTVKQKKILVSAAIEGFSGQLSTFKPHAGDQHPCYQCLYPALKNNTPNTSCTNLGVLGSIAGLIGSWQATEVIKEILNLEGSLSGFLLMIDGLTANTKKIKIARNVECGCCKNSKNF